MADAVVVIGASAGGVEALREVLGGLPDSLAAGVLVVLHLAPVESKMARVLAGRSTLPVRWAEDGIPIEPGVAYVAPPDRHLLVWPRRMRVVRGPHENLHRPAIDPLFRSAALAYGQRVVAVVLTGSRDDGAAGAQVVTQHGGHVIVQDPAEALFPSMPLRVIAADDPDEVLRLHRIPKAIVSTLGAIEATPAVVVPGRDD